MEVDRPEATSSVQRWASRFAGAVVIIGGVLIVAGSLLPWSAGEDGPLFAFAWAGVGLADWVNVSVLVSGFGILAAGLVAIVAGIATGRRPWLWKVTLLACAVAGVLAWVGFDRAVKEAGGFSHPYIEGYGEHIGEKDIGIWYVLVGAVVGGIASLARRGLRSPDVPTT